MCTLFANLYVLLTWAAHMVYMGTPYIFHIYMIRRGWLGCFVESEICKVKLLRHPDVIFNMLCVQLKSINYKLLQRYFYSQTRNLSTPSSYSSFFVVFSSISVAHV